MDTRRAGDLIDDRGHPQFPDHLPGRGDVAEGPVLALVGQARVFAGQTVQDLLFGAQVHLIDDPGFAVHARRFHQVHIRLVATALRHDRTHNSG